MCHCVYGKLFMGSVYNYIIFFTKIQSYKRTPAVEPEQSRTQSNQVEHSQTQSNNNNLFWFEPVKVELCSRCMTVFDSVLRTQSNTVEPVEHSRTAIIFFGLTMFEFRTSQLTVFGCVIDHV